MKRINMRKREKNSNPGQTKYNEVVKKVKGLRGAYVTL